MDSSPTARLPLKLLSFFYRWIMQTLIRNRSGQFHCRDQVDEFSQRTCCTPGGQEHPEKKGGTVPTGAYVYQFGIAGKKRNASWEGLRKLILPALENGESIYVHCMAGVHRAPVAAALILAAVRQLPFDRMMQHIQKLRAVEPHKMIKGDVGEWVYTANIGPLPGPQVKIPVPFVTSKVDGSLMHAVPKDWDPDSPAPACRWRQSKADSRGFYSGNIEYVDDVFAAIAY